MIAVGEHRIKQREGPGQRTSRENTSMQIPVQEHLQFGQSCSIVFYLLGCLFGKLFVKIEEMFGQ